MASNTVIQTNVLALNSHRNLSMIGSKKEKASQRLSSGYRINTAADDAAGLAISEKMRAQINGLDGASKNVQDGISLVAVAESGMQTINDMLIRIRELLVDASNDTKEAEGPSFNAGDDFQDRQKIEDEILSLIDGINDMAWNAEFNKKKLLSGTYAETFAAPGDKFLASDPTGGVPTDVAIPGFTKATGDPGSLWFQIGANSGQGVKVSINPIGAYYLGLTTVDLSSATNQNATSDKITVSVLHASGEQISKLIDRVDYALKYVTQERSKMGAMQNRMEYTDQNLQVTSESLSAANSRIRDADMSKEMMNITKTDIIQQAAISMLAKANQAPQAVLQLLQG